MKTPCTTKGSEVATPSLKPTLHCARNAAKGHWRSMWKLPNRWREKNQQTSTVYNLLLLLRMEMHFNLWFQDAFPWHVTGRHSWKNLFSGTCLSVFKARLLLVSLSNITQTHWCCIPDLASSFFPVQISRILCEMYWLPHHWHYISMYRNFTNSILLLASGQPSRGGTEHMTAHTDASSARFWLNR